MEEWERNNLIQELARGRELARQLQTHLTNTRPPSTVAPSHAHDQTRGLELVQMIISSFEKALSSLNFSSSSPSTHHHSTGLVVESPPSLSGSDASDPQAQDPKDASKKGWTRKVRVSPGVELEGPLDDGFSWRKYGQKDILGAKYPRGYYRCTHRNGQGCLATKQVQRSDEDPTIFEVHYRGSHTCSHHHQPSDASLLFPSSSTLHYHQSPEANVRSINTVEPTQQQPEEALLNLGKHLQVVTQDLDDRRFPPFHQFPSPSSSHMPAPSMVTSSNFWGNFPPSYVSPQASGSRNFNFQVGSSTSRDSDLTETLISSGHAAAATSSTKNSPPAVGLLDFPFGNTNADHLYDPNNVTFDPNSGFFSSSDPYDK